MAPSFTEEIFWDDRGDVSRKKMICIKKKYPADHQNENSFASKKHSKGPEPSCCKVFVCICSILKNLADHQKEN